MSTTQRQRARTAQNEPGAKAVGSGHAPHQLELDRKYDTTEPGKVVPTPIKIGSPTTDAATLTADVTSQNEGVDAPLLTDYGHPRPCRTYFNSDLRQNLPTEGPVLRGVLTGTSLRVWCPYCDDFHLHNWSREHENGNKPSHRNAHCDPRKSLWAELGYLVGPVSEPPPIPYPYVLGDGDRFGNWRFFADSGREEGLHFSLCLYRPGTEHLRYQLDLEKATNSAMLLDHIFQLVGYELSAQDYRDLLVALREILNPQATLCSGGANKTLKNPREFINRRVKRVWPSILPERTIQARLRGEL